MALSLALSFHPLSSLEQGSLSSPGHHQHRCTRPSELSVQHPQSLGQSLPETLPPPTSPPPVEAPPAEAPTAEAPTAEAPTALLEGTPDAVVTTVAPPWPLPTVLSAANKLFTRVKAASFSPPPLAAAAAASAFPPTALLHFGFETAGGRG